MGVGGEKPSGQAELSLPRLRGGNGSGGCVHTLARSIKEERHDSACPPTLLVGPHIQHSASPSKGLMVRISAQRKAER